jgi:diacylglycerol kinase (ATP)
VWDLSVNGDPCVILESFLVFTRLRILVCGGDGTVAWIINTMEKLNVSSHRQYPPIAILPLGTGNDLSRILGWGGGYNNESLIVILEQISESYVSLLDQWEVTIHEAKNGGHPKHANSITTKGFLNYLGVGADAQAALQVHNLREIRPQWFFSRLVNKAMYGIFGAEDILKATTINVRKDIQLFADGVKVPLPHDSQGIILMNIDSYAGGVPLWSHGLAPPSSSDSVINMNAINRARSFNEVEQFRHHPMDKRYASQDLLSSMSHDNMAGEGNVRKLPTSTEEERYAEVTACDIPCSCQDGYLEIVSIRGAFHLGQIKVGLSNAQRLCQCREATIVIRNKVAVQVDGEPWRQNTCTIKIRRKKEQAVMLHRSADDGGVETEMSKLLEWAEARKMIDSHVHALLMKEFSRRIESKTRQRRAVARQQHDNTNFMHFTSTIKKAISSGGMCAT